MRLKLWGSRSTSGGFSKRTLYRKMYGSGRRGPNYKTWTPPVGLKWRGRGKPKAGFKPTRKNFDIGSY